MDLVSNKIGREKLRAGDHIYTWRSGYSYSHHGIYVGDGKVIHLTRGPGFFISSSSKSQQSNDRVVCCNIEDFLCDGQLYRFEYSVTKVVFLINRPGTCSLASSDPPEHVLHRASYLLEHGFSKYDLMDKNCEDFAIYCKTGIIKGYTTEGGISGQIRAVVAALLAITVIPHQFLPASLIGITLMVCGLYCIFRIQLDVGSKGTGIDPRIVAVENLDHLSYKMNMMEKSTTRWFLHKSVVYYMAYTLWAIRIWYWTPESTILKWLKSDILYWLLYIFVSDHLRLHGFKLGEYSAYTIWLLGYLCWRWSSVSTILLCTRLLYLLDFLESFISNQPNDPRRLKLNKYVATTIWVLELWYWTPKITILQWLKFALLYIIFIYYVPDHLRNHLLMRRAFFICFVIQSATLFLGLDYSDFIFRIIKNITFL